MSLQGPVVVIADRKDAELAAVLATAGAFPVVEAAWRDGANAISRVEPAAVVLADANALPDRAVAQAVGRATEGEPYLPVVARMAPTSAPPVTGVLPMAADAAPDRIAIRLASALRVRTLHATALRRLAA